MSGAHDLFWVASYAHNTLQPIIDQMNEADPELKAYLNTEIAGRGAGLLTSRVKVVVWTDSPVRILMQSGVFNATKAEIDSMAERLPAKALEPVA